jgi:hypothetical protein
MNAHRRRYFLVVLGALELAWASAALGAPAPWIGTIPVQSHLCVQGASAPDHDLDDRDLEPLYKAAKAAGLSTIGHPFVRSLQHSGGPQGERKEWTLCAPIAAGSVSIGGPIVEAAPATPAVFLFCPGDPHDVARRCAGDLEKELDKAAVKPAGIARGVAVPPVDEAMLAGTVGRQVADTAAIRLDAPVPMAGSALELTDLGRQLLGEGEQARQLRPLGGKEFRPAAGGAVPQQGVAVFFALTGAQADSLSQALSAPPSPPRSAQPGAGPS